MSVWTVCPIKGEKYLISKLGEISRRSDGKRMKTFVNKNGYEIIGFYDERIGKTRHYRVHRLVAKAFIPNPDGKGTVNHKDGNKLNNRVENLEWATYQENLIHARKTGLNVVTQKQRDLAAKNIMVNRLLAKPEKPCFCVENGVRTEFPSIKEAAKFVGGCSSAIVLCCKGKKKTYKGRKWGYA